VRHAAPLFASHGALTGSCMMQETVVLKLNGGLGTSMGLDKAKSLLTVKGTDTFLDLTAKQVKLPQTPDLHRGDMSRRG
jgi:UDP-N-acetylglucosamine pyrophosphorylase